MKDTKIQVQPIAYNMKPDFFKGLCLEFYQAGNLINLPRKHTIFTRLVKLFLYCQSIELGLKYKIIQISGRNIKTHNLILLFKELEKLINRNLLDTKQIKVLEDINNNFYNEQKGLQYGNLNTVYELFSGWKNLDKTKIEKISKIALKIQDFTNEKI